MQTACCLLNSRYFQYHLKHPCTKSYEGLTICLGRSICLSWNFWYCMNLPLRCHLRDWAVQRLGNCYYVTSAVGSCKFRSTTEPEDHPSRVTNCSLRRPCNRSWPDFIPWIACVASVSVGFGSKERDFWCFAPFLYSLHFRAAILCSRTPQKRLLRRLYHEGLGTSL